VIKTKEQNKCNKKKTNTQGWVDFGKIEKAVL
jgi:hypothetical protein